TGTRAIAPAHVAFPSVGRGRHSQTVISELNTAPVHSPANASPRHHWSSTHSSGPERIATPYSVVDFHHLLHAGFCRRFPNVPFYRVFSFRHYGNYSPNFIGMARVKRKNQYEGLLLPYILDPDGSSKEYRKNRPD
ncbi:MAG: hypothetical protein V3W43_05890, partial [Desulfatiglandaceae bacterium]